MSQTLLLIHNRKIKLKLIVFVRLRLPYPLQAPPKLNKQTNEKTSGTQSNLDSISAVSRVQSSVWARFPKQRLRDKRGRVRIIFSLNGRKRLSSSTMRFTLSTETVSCGRQIYSRTNLVSTVVRFCRFWYEFTVLLILRHLVCQSVQRMAICRQEGYNLAKCSIKGTGEATLMFFNYATKTLTCLVPRFYSACNVSGFVQLTERW